MDQVWVLLGEDGDGNIGYFWGLFSTPEKAFEVIQRNRETSFRACSDQDGGIMKYPSSAVRWHLHFPYTLVKETDSLYQVIGHSLNREPGMVVYEIVLSQVDQEIK